MRKILLIIIIAVLAGFLCFQVYNKVNNTFYDTKTELIENEDFFYPSLNLSKIDSSLIVETHDRYHLPLWELISDSTLFVRFLATGCKPCIDNVLSQLHLLKAESPNNNIVLLIGNISNRDLYVNFIQHGKDFIMMKSDFFPLDTIIDQDSPYLFTVNSDNRILNHFICQYGDTENLKKYIQQFK